MKQERNVELVVPALNNRGKELIDGILGQTVCVKIKPIPIDKNPYHILKAYKSLVKEFSTAQYIYTTAGILFDQKIWNPLYNFVIAYTPLLIYAKHVNPNMKIIGNNVGITLKTRTIGKWLLKKCVNLHERIYLREAGEAALLGELQYKGDTFISADNVFGYHKPVIQQFQKREKQIMYINLTLYGVEDRKTFLRELIRFVDQMKEKYEIYFFQTSTRDLQLAEMVCKKTLSEENRVYSLALMGYDKIQELLSVCDILVGMRMHAIIFAIKRGCPVIAISYSSKVNRIQNRRAEIIKQIYDEAERFYLTCNQYK